MNDRKKRFESIKRTDVPHTRKGKHRDIVSTIIEEVLGLRGSEALKIPRRALGAAKIEHIRAALSRASARTELDLATTTDDDFFYVWRQNGH